MSKRQVPTIVSGAFYILALRQANAEPKQTSPRKGVYIFTQDPHDDVEFPSENYPRCGKTANVYLDNLRKVTIDYGADFKLNGDDWSIDIDDGTGLEARKNTSVNGGELRANFWSEAPRVFLLITFFGTDENGKINCASARHYSLISHR